MECIFIPTGVQTNINSLVGGQSHLIFLFIVLCCALHVGCCNGRTIEAQGGAAEEDVKTYELQGVDGCREESAKGYEEEQGRNACGALRGAGAWLLKVLCAVV